MTPTPKKTQPVRTIEDADPLGVKGGNERFTQLESGKRTKLEVLRDRLLDLSPTEVRRAVECLRAHPDGEYVVDMLKRAIAAPASREEA
jgi:hypothetical protein